MSYLVTHAKGGDNRRNNYICDSVRADILIFGSSRAVHHYNPIIIADSLGMSCYNCGQDANGSILNYARYQLILQRYKPKVVVYDVYPVFDLLKGEDNHKFLGWLRAYYDRPGIQEVFASVDKTEIIKMISKTYRYNSKFVQICSDFFHPLSDDGIYGFRPVDKLMDPMKKNSGLPTSEKIEVDSLKFHYLKRIIDYSQDVKFYFVVSPHWNGIDPERLICIKNYCAQKSIPFIDFSNNPDYKHIDAYFTDGSHMNAKGADKFTRELISYLKQQ